MAHNVQNTENKFKLSRGGGKLGTGAVYGCFTLLLGMGGQTVCEIALMECLSEHLSKQYTL